MGKGEGRRGDIYQATFSVTNQMKKPMRKRLSHVRPHHLFCGSRNRLFTLDFREV
jgi:hypothetical protein